MADNSDLKDLIDAHWNYVRNLLEAHGTNKHVIKACEYHYKSAFKHGYKHCKEEYMVAGVATSTNQPVDSTKTKWGD